MAEIIEPKAFVAKEVFDFPDGSKVTLEASDGDRITLQGAVYLLEDVKYQILQMSRMK